jgi:hypothetical protein
MGRYRRARAAAIVRGMTAKPNILVAALAALGAVLPLSAVASAGPMPARSVRSCGTLSAAGGDVLRVYALRGVSCRRAERVARVFSSTPTAPAPWHCLTGTGQRYRGKAVSFACGYGSRGPVMKRRHAFVAVQAHTSG